MPAKPPPVCRPSPTPELTTPPYSCLQRCRPELTTPPYSDLQSYRRCLRFARCSYRRDFLEPSSRHQKER